MSAFVNPGEIGQFETDGLLTLDGPYSDRQVSDAAAVCDRILTRDNIVAGKSRATRFMDYYEPELLDLMQHPWLEEMSKTLLRADSVELFSSAITKTYPQHDRPFGAMEHTDAMYTRSGWQATPRRAWINFFVWLTDVTHDCAPMMCRPASHLMLADYFEQHPDQVGIGGLNSNEFPDFDYPEQQFCTAKAGQVTVVSLCNIHGPTTNTGDRVRMSISIGFKAKAFDRDMSPVAHERCDVPEFFRNLHDHFRPDRAHLIPDPDRHEPKTA